MEQIVLHDGNVIPAVGFGVFLIPNHGPAYTAVREALRVGYRHIDGAAVYLNESDVGRAVRDSGLPREEIFVTSKLWLQDFAYADAKKAIDTTLQNLGLDYLDLYLIHQPYGKVDEAWRAMEEAQRAGKIKSLGVSNMTPKIWNAFVPHFATLPTVNQVECHPFFQQRELRQLLEPLQVKIEAYYPLCHGSAALLGQETVTALAAKYGKTAAQILLRFEVQDGLIVLPKSVQPERIAANIDIFDFALSDAEMAAMRALDTGSGVHDPDRPGVAESLLARYKVHD